MKSRLSLKRVMNKSILGLLMVLGLGVQLAAHASVVLLNDGRYVTDFDGVTGITYTPDTAFMDWSVPYQTSSVSSSLMTGNISAYGVFDKVRGEFTYSASYYVIDFEVTESTTARFSGDFTGSSDMDSYDWAETRMVLTSSSGPDYYIALLQTAESSASMDYINYGVNTLSFSEIIDLAPGQYALRVQSTVGETFYGANATGDFNVSFVPVPAAIWLFGSGLLVFLRWPKRR